MYVTCIGPQSTLGGRDMMGGDILSLFLTLIRAQFYVDFTHDFSKPTTESLYDLTYFPIDILLEVVSSCSV